jgi:coiled-coil domain-containing protein 12
MPKTSGTLPQVSNESRVNVVPPSGVAEEPILANRNFDPETRTLRKHQANVAMEDTLEHNVKGLAERIIAEDEAKRAQDLVTFMFH